MKELDREPEGEADLVGGAGPTGDPGAAGGLGEPAGTGPGSDRRAFLRQLSGDAVTSAGRLAGLSSALRRSVFVAGQTAINGLEAVAPNEAIAPKPEPSATGEPSAAGTPAGSEPPTTEPPGAEPPAAAAPPREVAPFLAAEPPVSEPSATEPPATEPAPAARGTEPGPAAPDIAALVAAAPEVPDPVRSLTPDQQRFLADALHSIVAVTDPAGPPHLTSSACHWDGAIFRLPAQMFTARATYLDRDPRVSLLIGQPGARESVMVSGVASSVYGDEVEADMLSILGREMTPEAAIGAWEKLRASGDRMVVRIRPTRFVWRRV